MTLGLTKAQAGAYKRRWKMVNAAEIRELRKTTPLQKFRQLSALMASVDGMGWRKALKEEEKEVRERWIKLYRIYHGQK